MAKIDIVYKVKKCNVAEFKVTQCVKRHERIITDDRVEEYEIEIVDTGCDDECAYVRIEDRMVRRIFKECTKVIVDGVTIFP